MNIPYQMSLEENHQNNILNTPNLIEIPLEYMIEYFFFTICWPFCFRNTDYILSWFSFVFYMYILIGNWLINFPSSVLSLVFKAFFLQ